MLRNDLKLALRTLWKHKTVSAINVAGLALSGAVVLLIALFVHHEWSYDTVHAKADRIVQVTTVAEGGPEGLSRIGVVPAPLPDVLRDRASGVERIAAVQSKTTVVKRGDDTFESDVLYAEPTLLKMFTVPFVHGAPDDALRRPDAVVLTTERARQYFGRTDVVGEPLDLRIGDAFTTLTVSGVVEPAPSRSSLPLGVVVPYERAQHRTGWQSCAPLLYAELTAPGETAALEATLDALLQEHVPDADSRRFALLPLLDTHLTPGVYGQLAPTSDPVYSTILIGIAAFILALALINFTTLSLARSADRGREVGMCKALGAYRGQVAMQFGGEALLTTGISLVLSVGLAMGALPVFESLVNRSLDASVLLSPWAVGGGLALWGLVAAAAGAYPAGVLSGFRPITALRDRAQLSTQPRLVAGLVVLQFVLAMVLVAGTVVMWNQFTLLQDKPLGFDSAHVVQLDGRLLQGSKGDVMLNRLADRASSTAAIQHVSGAWQSFGMEDSLPNRLPATSGDQTVEVHALRIAPGFADVFDLQLRTGRMLSPDRPSDPQSAVVVNRSFVEAMGWDEPLGKPVSIRFAIRDAEVVGVVEDFHFQSLHAPIRPLALHMNPIAPTSTFFARLAPGQTAAGLDVLQEAWASVAPNVPFQATFMDDALQRQYDAEQRWATIITGAAGMALFIAALGLLGLALLAAQRRLREISIRKVLGASDRSVLLLVTRRFVALVGVAIVLAVPVAYVGASEWLQSFAYRIDLGWAPFAIAAGVVLVVSLVAAGTQVWRVTRRDPAHVLRTE